MGFGLSVVTVSDGLWSCETDVGDEHATKCNEMCESPTKLTHLSPYSEDMADADIEELIDRMNRELEATTYALRSIEIAVVHGGYADTDSVVRTNIADNEFQLRDWRNLGDRFVSRELEWNYPTARGAANRMSAMLVGTVCEILDPQEGLVWDQKNLHDHAEMQFLRRVRNGVFHGNRFGFRNYNGSGAAWRGCELTMEMKNKPVFTEIEGNRLYLAGPESRNDFDVGRDINEGLLEAGDGLALVDDIIDILIEETG